MRVLVTGSTGFVGSRLCPALASAGHSVRAMTRRPDSYLGVGEPVYGDVREPGSLPAALAGQDAAYYLVHLLTDPDFARLDAGAAVDFAEAASRAGLRRIVYLGGLGDESRRLSEHLRSRREVEGLLGSTGVPVTTLRAGIVVGNGGLSWELARQLADRLPGLLTPTWGRNRVQPIAVADAVRYLVEVLGEPATAGRAFEVGGADVLSYNDMVRRVASLQGRLMPVVEVAPLTLALPVLLSGCPVTSWWLSAGLRLLTDLDTQSVRTLLHSMNNEAVVREDSIKTFVPFQPLGYDHAVLAALSGRDRVGGPAVPAR